MNLHQYCLTESFRLDSCDGLIKHTHLIDWMSYVKYTLYQRLNQKFNIELQLMQNYQQMRFNY
ncbi:unnamed protein product [Paramecium primaurelia]|uniref:Uncharacterized protein n=1 Tax=Paramecium primaurelia TaxID=5886 RepID=A0A8S1JNH7_PARPR|nr:unnamed protein product [Paramecium primaurelia]CAD8043927.1 unnamed protein product [Paramecium primaurelia]